jgi:uncharacterized damage-inducible protein DinB
MNYYTVMAGYNEWMNQQLYALCADLPDDERRRDLGALFKSIHGTLNHILIGDLIWLGRFTQQPVIGGTRSWDDRSAVDAAMYRLIGNIEWTAII